MRLTTLAACLLCAAPASAQNERQPDRTAQPAQPRLIAAPRLLALEEEVDVLAAERELREAHLKIAKLGAEHARFEFERVEKATAAGAAGREDAVRARVQSETALAQVQVRAAELRIVEVKLTYAKKRLEEAKAAPARPNPFDRPREPKVDPKPGERPRDPLGERPDVLPPGAAERATAELELRATVLERLAGSLVEREKRAAASADAAKKELADLRDAATRGRVRAGAIETAEAKAKEAAEAAEQAAKARKANDDELAALRKKIKELQK